MLGAVFMMETIKPVGATNSNIYSIHETLGDSLSVYFLFLFLKIIFIFKFLRFIRYVSIINYFKFKISWYFLFFRKG